MFGKQLETAKYHKCVLESYLTNVHMISILIKGNVSAESIDDVNSFMCVVHYLKNLTVDPLAARFYSRVRLIHSNVINLSSIIFIMYCFQSGQILTPAVSHHYFNDHGFLHCLDYLRHRNKTQLITPSYENIPDLIADQMKIIMMMTQAFDLYVSDKGVYWALIGAAQNFLKTMNLQIYLNSFKNQRYVTIRRKHISRTFFADGKPYVICVKDINTPSSRNVLPILNSKNSHKLKTFLILANKLPIIKCE